MLTLDQLNKDGIKIESLKTGARFKAIDGKIYKVKSHDRYVTWVIGPAGESTCFCNSALGIPV